ncbi:MAG: peptidylprolyl isomerase, partial [Oscillospiraceae bacterium]
MSASREKKQRQASPEPTLSSRAQEEQKKAAERKRNTIIYSIIGAVVVILAAILLIWDSGIVQRNTTVATIDGEKVTASQVAYYYYNNNIIYYAQLYSQWGYSSTYSTSVSPKEQVITESALTEYGISEDYLGKTYHEYFLDSALDSLRQEYALRAAAKKAGYTLSDEGKESVKSSMESIDDTLDSYLTNYGANLSRTSYLQMVYGNSMSAGKYRTCLENAQLASEFYSEYFDTLTDYTDEELDAYYEEHATEMNTVRYYWREFDGSVEETTDADGNTVEPTEEESAAALAAAKEAAEAAQAEVKGNLDAVRNNDDYNESNGVPSTGNFAYDWLVDSARQPGDTEIFDGVQGYYLLVFEESYRNEDPTVNVRHILIEAVHEDDPATEEDESTDDLTDEDYAAAEQKAQEILDQWKAGEATEESFAALAEEYSADPGSNTNGGLYEKVAEGDMIADFNDWIFDSARQSGDTGLVKNTQSSTKGWHIIYYIGQDEPVWKTDAREGKWASDLKANVEIVRTDKLDSIAD